MQSTWKVQQGWCKGFCKREQASWLIDKQGDYFKDKSLHSCRRASFPLFWLKSFQSLARISTFIPCDEVKVKDYSISKTNQVHFPQKNYITPCARWQRITKVWFTSGVSNSTCLGGRWRLSLGEAGPHQVFHKKTITSILKTKFNWFNHRN